MGMTVTLVMLEQRWLAMLIGITALLIARAVGIFGTGLLDQPSAVDGVVAERSYQGILFIGSLRGAAVLAR